MATAAQPDVPPMPEPSFRDGLGVRYVVTDPVTEDRLERLCVSTEVGRQAQAIQDRVSRLLNFRHARFPRVRGLEIDKQPNGTAVAWVIAEPAEGIRLIDLLRLAEQSHLSFDVNTILQFAREILPALATLHDSRDVTHGAIGPERLVMSPQGRITVVDHVFGAALTKLQYPRVRLWRDFRISMPPAAGVPQFDPRADVAGVAMTMLAMLVGRPLTLNEYPDHLKDLLDRGRERLGTGPDRPITASLRAWLERALPLDSRKPLLTALDAQVALDAAIKKERAYAPGVAAVKHFIERVAPVLAAVNWGAPVVEAPLTPAGPVEEQAAATAPVRKPALRTTGRPAPRRLTPEEEEAEEIAFLERELARLAAEAAEATPAAAGSASGPASDGSAPVVVAETSPVAADAPSAPAAEVVVSTCEASATAAPAALPDAPVVAPEFTIVGNDGAPLVPPTEPEPATVATAELVGAPPEAVDASEPVTAAASIDAPVPAPAAEVVDLSALLDAAVESAGAAEPAPAVAPAASVRGRSRSTKSRVAAHAGPEPRRKSHAHVASGGASAANAQVSDPAPDLAASSTPVPSVQSEHADDITASAVASADRVVDVALDGLLAELAAAPLDGGAEPAAPVEPAPASSDVCEIEASSEDLGTAFVEILSELPRRLASSPHVPTFEFSEGGTVDLTGELDGLSESADRPESADVAPLAEAFEPMVGQAPSEPESPTAAVSQPSSEVTVSEPVADTAPASTLRDARALVDSPLARALRPVVPIVSEDARADGSRRPSARATNAQRRRARGAGRKALPERTTHAPATIVRSRQTSVLDDVVDAHVPALRVFAPAAALPAAPAPRPSLPERCSLAVDGALACAPAEPMLRIVARTSTRQLSLVPASRPPAVPVPRLLADRSVLVEAAGVGLGQPATLAFQPAFALFRPPVAVPAAAGRVDDVPVGVVVFDHATAITGEIAEVCYSAAAYQPAGVEFREPMLPPASAGRVDHAPAGVRVFDSTTAIAGDIALHCYSADAYQPASVEFREPPAVPAAAGRVDDVPVGVVVFDHSTAITGEIAEVCYSAAAYQPATVAFRESPAPPASAGRVDGAPAGIVLFDNSTAIDEPVLDAAPSVVAEPALAFAEYQAPPAVPPQAGRVDEVPAGVRVFDHSNAIEGDVADTCYSAVAYQPATVEFRAPGQPPASAGRVDGVPAGVVLFDASTAVAEPLPPVAVVHEAPVSALPISSAEPEVGGARPERVGNKHRGLSPDEELRRLLESLEVVDEEPARASHEAVEIDLTSAILAAEEPAATPVVSASVAPIVATAIAAAPVVVPVVARAVEGAAAIATTPATSAPADAVESQGARAGGGKRRRSKSRGRHEHRPVETPAAKPLVEVDRVEPEIAPVAKPAVQAPPQLRVVPPRQVTTRPATAAPAVESAPKVAAAAQTAVMAAAAAEPVVTPAAKVERPVAAAPQAPRPGDVASSPTGRIHHASPAIEATLPQYAPWLTADPLPPGAAEATSHPKTISLAGVTADAQDAATPPAAAAPSESPAVRLVSASDRSAQTRVPQPAEPAPAARSAPISQAPTTIRLAAPPDVSVSTGIRLATPEPVRPTPLPGPQFGTSTGAPSAVLSRAALDERMPDVSPAFAISAAANEVRSASRGHWPKALVASVAVILLAGAAFGAYWYAAPSATGTLSVQSSVAGVEVMVDGRGRGNTPLKLDLAPGRHVIEMRGFGTTRTLPVEITAGVLTTQNVKWPAGRQSGTLKVMTSPAGASVKLDGDVRGVTPVELEGVTEGTHTLRLEAETGTLTKSIKVVAGETTTVDEPIYKGFLTVFAPYRVKILEDGVSLGSSEDGKLMLGCGTHKLEFVNTTFNVRELRTVEVSPGGTTAVSLEAPRGEIEVVNVADGTEVWVDNEPKGTTPMGRIALPVGTHNVLLRPGQGRSFTVEVVAGKVIQVPKGSR